MSTPATIHLIPNAHLDPVWLWDWREGLNEGIATSRAILGLMDEFPDLTFIRGEAAIYAHIERYAPDVFARIRQRIAEGRWDVVGGTYVQPDTNLPATETFVRHFVRGARSMREKLGVRVRAGWAADSFGHSAGLPDILAAAGIESYAFTRPSAGQIPLAKPAFWWVGAGGARILAYRPPVGWYGAEREEMGKRLDAVLAHASGSELRNIACFYGLGNHGGGPTRRQILDIRAWAAEHPGVRIRHSTLHAFFDALRREIRARGEGFIPVHRGELNFCLRGCYSAAAKVKFTYRKAEAELGRAETASTAAAALLKAPALPLAAAWDGLLFNSFHDILPGSSIERACDDQIAWLGGVRHAAAATETDALNRLAAAIDTSVRPVRGDKPTAVPFLVWNPHPHPFHGHVELEGNVDSRPIWAYSNRVEKLPLEVRGPDGRALPFQAVATENTAFPHLVWRKRVVVPVTLPPLGWGVYTLGYVEGAEPPAQPERPLAHAIRNAFLAVSARPGARQIVVRTRRGKVLSRLGAVTVEDPWGSWGGMAEEPESCDLSAVRHTWVIDRVEALESGPERHMLGVTMRAGASQLELRLSLWRDRNAVDVSARVLWNERSARLKLAMAGAGTRAEFEVPGGTVVRKACGEVPGGRWVRSGALGVASDALYNFDLREGELRATVCRASRYANDSRVESGEQPWLAVVDRGELTFRFLMTGDVASLPRMAAELERPPVTLAVPAAPGRLPRAGSILALSGAPCDLLALKPAEEGAGAVLRVRARAAGALRARWLGKAVGLGRVRAGEIATWRLAGTRATRIGATESGQ